MSVRRRLPLCLGTLALLLALLSPAYAQAEFGIESFSAIATNEDKTASELAGSHPDEYTVSFTMNQDEENRVEGTMSELFIDLPAGFIGNPRALPTCTRAQFVFNLATTCPGSTQLGIVEVKFNGSGEAAAGLYNLTPSPGSAATLGTHLDRHFAVQDASLRTGADYGVTVADVTLPTVLEIQSVTARIWGLPMAKSHDALRLCIPENPEEPQFQGCASEAPPKPFLTMPTRCGEELETTLRVRSVEGGADSLSASSPPLKGCEALGFEPRIEAKPETARADSPTGLSVGIEIPQNDQPGARSSAHLRDTVVTLPAGLAVNPSAAIGRSACSLEQIDLKGPGPANCPDASKVGTVKATTPLLDHPLPGSVYLARQSENPFGSLIALYVAIEDPLTGIIVKQAIKVEPDPLTGRLSAFTEGIPQAPIEKLDFDFFGGPRGALTTPPTCGPYTTQTLFTPWSAPEGKAKEPGDSFQISEAAAGGPCPQSEAQMPNAPGFEAGTTAPLAGAYSPFVLKVTRANGSQRISALNVTLPPGLAAKLAGVSECSEAQIAAAGARSNPGEGAAELASPSCPASSEVGTVNVGAGSGTPLYVQGHAYLAGPYKGAPLSMVIITPAVAGPFDLGVVVVRAALYVDETTAQVTVKSDPIPQILQGIPLAVQSVAVHVDRDQFTLNPTSCSEKEIKAEAISPIGAAAQMKARFATTGCSRLRFAPRLKLSLLGANQMRKTGHPALKALVTYPKGAGYANIARAQVILPATEFVDQFHIANPCKLAQFAEGACPPASILGTARAYSPLLDKPLEGKVIFRANGGVRELPDVVADLNGQVHFVLVGINDSVGRGEISRVRNTFALVPDAPVSKFELNLFAGKRGLFENSANLCRTTPRATVRLTAQNGLTQNTNQVVATSCKKPKAPRRHRGHR